MLRTLSFLFSFLSCLAACAAVQAEPNEYVELAGGERGELQLELRSGVSRNRDDSHLSAHALSLGYGFTQRWFSEVVAKYVQGPGENHYELEGIEWENKFALLYAADGAPRLSALVELEHLQEHGAGYELRMGPLLQAHPGHWQWNFNPLWTRLVHSDFAHDTEFGYQVQARHALHPGFWMGVQGFGDLGPWDDWLPSRQQSHRFGPAVFGSVNMERDESVFYDAALLLGTGGAAPRYTLRAQLEFQL